MGSNRRREGRIARPQSLITKRDVSDTKIVKMAKMHKKGNMNG
jgi:hypothetical protein